MAATKDVHDPLWINSVPYDAEELRRNQGYQLAAGATPGTSRTGLLNPRDLALSLSGNNVMAGAGGAVIGTAKGAYVCGVASTTTIGAMLAADVTNPRRDRVVLEVLDPDNGGGAGRKAQLRIIDGTPNALAATGGGFPAAPTSPFIDLGYVDVPKSGAGSPSITVTAPLTAAAGAPVPVRKAADMEALPKWVGAQCARLDLEGAVFTCDGTTWKGTSHAEFTGPIVTTQPGIGTNPGNLTKDGAIPTDSSFVQADAAGALRVLVSGVYEGGFMVYPAAAPGKSTAIISTGGVDLGKSVGGDYGGSSFGAVMMPKFLPANTVLNFQIATSSAVNIGSRVTLTRIA